MRRREFRALAARPLFQQTMPLMAFRVCMNVTLEIGEVFQ